MHTLAHHCASSFLERVLFAGGGKRGDLQSVHKNKQIIMLEDR